MTDSTLPDPQRAPWWQRGVVYQIYPRSFQDSDGDGVGDLRGIARRLEHVRDLGADAVWLSPIFTSPMADFGYDVADYTGVDPLFGTMEDFDALLGRAHELGLKLLLDLVPSHTSTAHAWFEASRRREGGKDDWYIWRDARPDGSLPNNWLSCFGGPAWEWDEVRGQYYLHSWDVAQADLNHRNPAVVEAILDVMRFWLEKGVDGFRVDVIEFMLKDARLRDEPENPDWREGMEPYARLLHPYSRNVPDVHGVIRRMREVIDAYDARVMIGEVFLSGEALAAYYGDRDRMHGDECQLPFNFGLVFSAWNAPAVRRTVDEYEGSLASTQWPNWVLGNHDQRRVASRIGAAQARVAQALLLTLRGTSTMYQGEELALENVPIPEDRIQDPQAKNQPGAGVLNRDEVRTPMPWDDTPNAGFTEPSATPWLPLADDAATRNVAAQAEDPTSQLALTRALLALRRAEPALALGSYAPVGTGSAAEAVFAFTRRHPEGSAFLIVLNFGPEAHTLDLATVAERAEIAVATGMERGGEVALGGLELGPDEGLVLRLV